MAVRVGRVTKIQTRREENDVVNVESLSYLLMKEKGKWDLINDLWEGTQSMRDAGEVWLPRHEAEQMSRYRDRLERTFLFNGFRDTIEKTAAKPFSKPIILKDIEESNLPEELIDLRFDVDKSGTTLHEFAKDTFIGALKYGVHHNVVDFPIIPSGLNLEEENIINPRPVWVQLPAPNLIGWRFDDNKELVQIRIKESKIVSFGNYLDKQINFIRVINKDSWELWQQVDESQLTQQIGSKFKLVNSGTHTFGRVPLVSFYTNQTGELTGMPPFLDLAWLNLAHWQSSSDQRNILRIARVTNLFMKGLTEKEKKAKTVVGADATFRFTNPDADMKFVEHSGKAIEAGQNDLDKLEDQMETLGLEPQIQKSGNVTATEKSIKSAKTQNVVQTWINDLESMITKSYDLSAEWFGTEMSKTFQVQIFSEFTLSLRADADIDKLIKIRQQGDIDQETALGEYKRRALLSDELIIEDVVEKTKEEKENSLAMFGNSDLQNDDDDDDMNDDNE